MSYYDIEESFEYDSDDEEINKYIDHELETYTTDINFDNCESNFDKMVLYCNYNNIKMLDTRDAYCNFVKLNSY